MKAEYIDHMGSDLSVVNAARVSHDKTSEWANEGVVDWVYNEQTKKVEFVFAQELKEKDANLIRYLARGMSSDDYDWILDELLETETHEEVEACLSRLRTDKHWTPFAHTCISLRATAPLPIRTQCYKHKQGLVENEESRRYISSKPTLFVPEAFRSKPVGNIKQGSGGVHPRSNGWLNQYEWVCQEAISLYESMITDGVCPEQARFVLPQGVEVSWIWTGNVFAFAQFCSKRSNPHAQKEIQDLAKMVSAIIEPLFPVSWRALING